MNPNAPHHEADDQSGDKPRREFEDALKAALHDVPVPGDLADRLIARLEESASERGTGNMPVPIGRSRSVSRRLFIAIGSLAVAVLVAVSVIWVRQSPRQVAREELSGEVTVWLSSLPPKSWRPVSTLPKVVTIDQGVTAQARQWQAVHRASSSAWSGSVTAIDLAPPSGPRAVLFVVRSNARFAVPSAPTATVRLGLSSGFVGTAWQRPSGVLFVLVVEADRGQRLEDFLRHAAQA